MVNFNVRLNENERELICKAIHEISEVKNLKGREWGEIRKKLRCRRMIGEVL